MSRVYHVSRKKTYEASQFTVNNGVSNYDVKTTASMFESVTQAHFTEIRTTQDISVKLNSTSNNSIQIASTDSPYSINPGNLGLIVRNVYISNASGVNSTVDIALT